MQNQVAEMNHEQEALASLLNELNLNDDEIIIQPEEVASSVNLEEVVGELEQSDALSEAYEKAAVETEQMEQARIERENEGIIDPLSLIAGPEAEPLPEVAEKPKKKSPKKGAAKKGEKKAEKKPAETAEKPAAASEEGNAPETSKKAEETPQKPATQPRKYYSNKVERLNDRMGDKMNEFAILEVDDAERDLSKLVEDFNATMKGAGVKVQNRIGFFTEFVSGKSDRLNSVCAEAVKVLLTDGKITTGEKGNLHTRLMKKYSTASAKAMGGNTIIAMQKLKMVVGDKGNWMPNPDSLYLMKLKQMLSIPDAA